MNRVIADADKSSTDIPQLSYAEGFANPFKRGLVRLIESLSGQPKLQRLYEAYRTDPGDEAFFSAAVRLLELDVKYDLERLQQIPDTGPLVVVANHPFGVLDGLLIAWLVSLRRSDFKILTNAVLDATPETKEWFLPIDFAPTREAQAVNLATRAECLKRLSEGECIIVFPAGGISTAPTPFTKAAVDDHWKPFTAKLITRSGAYVTPVYFEGQNSRIFQVASHIGLEFRSALIFREVERRIGTIVPIKIGETLSPEQLLTVGRRHDMMSFLREQTYGMATAATQKELATAQARYSRKKPAIFN